MTRSAKKIQRKRINPMNSLLKNTLLFVVLSASLSLNANNIQPNINNIAKNFVHTPNNFQVLIIYARLIMEFESLADYWDAKYAHTDSSMSNYNKVKKFVSRLEVNSNKANKFLHLARKIDGLNNEATEITESYKSFVSRGHRYLNNIKKDNKLRHDITTAMNNALLEYDEDIVATVDRMLEMIKQDSMSNSK
jgi:hypothetical protein